MTRRLLLILLVLAAPSLLGCDPEAGLDAGPPERDAGPPPPLGYDAGPVTRIPEAEAAAGRAECRFGRGAMPWQTIGRELPLGDEIPIGHFVLLMQENRSFDHYFGTMPGVEGIPAGASNPDADGNPVEPFHTDAYCVEDVNHGWNGSHRQFNGGLNDGFVVTNDPGGARALGYLDGTDLPFYWDLAQTFAFSDHHHCSVLGPTMVNRMYSLSGTSFGLISNDPIPTERMPADGEHLILEELDRAGIEWRVYYASVPVLWGQYPRYGLHPRNRARARPIEELFADLASGDVPPVIYIDPRFDYINRADASDEHPPANPQRGQAWVREIVTAVMQSPIWSDTALIYTYDEHGGFYDHVPPPEACAPGDFPPDLGVGDVEAGFDRLGFRVPLTVVSPWSRPGYVSDRVTDATSVLRLLQARFSLPALSGRDANAWPLLDMFDFADPVFLEPPTLAEAPVDEARVTACHAAFPE